MEEDIQLQFVTFQQAEPLKNLGFNCKCESYFYDKVGYEERVGLDNYNSDDDTVSRPTVSLALKWIRDTKGLHVWCQRWNVGSDGWHYYLSGLTKDQDFYSDKAYETFDEAESAGLTQALQELLKTEE